MNTSNASLKTTTEWNDTRWRKLERVTFKLQKRIYQASQRGDTIAVRKLQKMMLSSWSTKMLAVRKVTQDNRGKKTAGVDGVKALTPNERLQLVRDLDLSRKAKPIRRVWIPKPGKTEKRPLGIPVMHDRAAQALVKLTLEPEWEARFEGGSYGFRPGRSAHDAIGRIFQGIRMRPKFVLDADSKGCFDNIDHNALLRKVHTFPKLRRILIAWLKAGIMANANVEPSDKGTPQGGVISPLLANIALHGLEEKLKHFAENWPMRSKRGDRWLSKGPKRDLLTFVRYADDFVVLHDDRKCIEGCKVLIEQFLKEVGLHLSPEKTSIKHTLEPTEEHPAGFDFLGFTVRQHPVGKNQTGCDVRGNPLGFKTIITPSKKSLKRHTDELGEIIDAHKDGNKVQMIKRLNLSIQGWCNYYSTVCSGAAFSKAKDVLYHQIRRWVYKRHLNRSKGKANREYQTVNGRKWVLAASEQGLKLLSHIDTKIKRHALVRNKKSPYDGDWVYWSLRLANYPHANTRLKYALKRQLGKCDVCGTYLTSRDVIEIHHKDGDRSHNVWTNLGAVHGHCHDQIHGEHLAPREE